MTEIGTTAANLDAIDPLAAPALTLVSPSAARRTRAETRLQSDIFIPRRLIAGYVAGEGSSSNFAKEARGPRLTWDQVATVIAMIMIAWRSHRTDGQKMELTGKPSDIIALLGWGRTEELRPHLIDPSDGGLGTLTYYASLRSFEDERGKLVPPAKGARHWTIDVSAHVDDDNPTNFLKIPLWWLYRERRDVEDERSRVRRGIERCGKCGTWLDAEGNLRKGDRALRGALMVIERADHETGIQTNFSVEDFAERWGLSTSTVHGDLAEAEDRGYIAVDERAGGREGGADKGPGYAATRRVVTRPGMSPSASPRPGAAVGSTPGCPGCKRPAVQKAGH